MQSQIIWISTNNLYQNVIISLFDKYKKDINESFNSILPKVIEGKRHLNKIMKSIINITLFNQSEYEISSLKIIVVNFQVMWDILHISLHQYLLII